MTKTISVIRVLSSFVRQMKPMLILFLFFYIKWLWAMLVIFWKHMLPSLSGLKCAGCWTAGYIVAYRPVTKKLLCKQWPFLGNGSENTFLLLGSKFLIMQQLDYNNGNVMFLCDPCRDVISKGQSYLRVQAVLPGNRWRVDTSAWSWRISTVRSHCQGMAGEDIIWTT
jgi:hypothetical protein